MFIFNLLNFVLYLPLPRSHYWILIPWVYQSFIFSIKYEYINEKKCMCIPIFYTPTRIEDKWLLPKLDCLWMWLTSWYTLQLLANPNMMPLYLVYPLKLFTSKEVTLMRTQRLLTWITDLKSEPVGQKKENQTWSNGTNLQNWYFLEDEWHFAQLD